jgi:hypothetical protein
VSLCQNLNFGANLVERDRQIAFRGEDNFFEQVHVTLADSTVITPDNNPVGFVRIFCHYFISFLFTQTVTNRLFTLSFFVAASGQMR